jgi:hypothetical protein
VPTLLTKIAFIGLQAKRMEELWCDHFILTTVFSKSEDAKVKIVVVYYTTHAVKYLMTNYPYLETELQQGLVSFWVETLRLACEPIFGFSPRK